MTKREMQSSVEMSFGVAPDMQKVHGNEEVGKAVAEIYVLNYIDAGLGRKASGCMLRFEIGNLEFLAVGLIELTDNVCISFLRSQHSYPSRI